MESLQGNLLVGGAGILTPTFRQTVIFVAFHDDEGALGFVLNRPSDVELEGSPPPLGALPLVDARVFVGGPVQPDGVAILGEVERLESDDRPISGSLAVLSLDDSADVTRVRRAKVFAGYSGWGAGQLEGELERGDWLVEPASPEDVFTTDPDSLWRSVVARKGSAFRLLSTMPFDPSAN